MPKGYPDEFRRKVLELVAAGGRVKQVADDLGISDETVYQWRRQIRIDQGIEPGLTSGDRAELASARRRIRALEDEVAILRQARELLREPKDPKSRFAAIDVMAAEGLPVRRACLLLGVSEGGYYTWKRRAPSERERRHALLEDQIRAVHEASRGTYGARRVHAELKRLGIRVGHNQVELVMARAGIAGLHGRHGPRRAHDTQTAGE